MLEVNSRKKQKIEQIKTNYRDQQKFKNRVLWYEAKILLNKSRFIFFNFTFVIFVFETEMLIWTRNLKGSQDQS